jgi:hypothetical protein
MKYEFLNRVILFLTLFISIVFAQNQVMLQFSLSIFTIILSFYKPITNPYTNISLELFLWYFFIIIGFYGIFIG